MKKTGLLIVSVFLLLLTSCQKKGETVDLSRGWTYSLVSPDNPQCPFYPVLDEQLANLEYLVPDKYGTIWLKKTVMLPDSLKYKDIALYLGRITTADRTYFNGVLVGQEGDFPPEPFSAWNTARFYDLPDSIVKAGLNEILIEVFVNAEGSIVSQPFLGLRQDARNAYMVERFWNSQVHLLFAFVMLIIGIYHLMLFFFSKKEKENLYFSILNIVSVLYMIVFFVPEIPAFPYEKINFLLFQKIFSSGLPYVIPFLMCSFVNSFLKRKDHIAVMIVRVLVMAVPVILVFLCPDYIYLRTLRNYIQVLMFVPIVWCVCVIVYKAVKKTPNAAAILWGFSPFLFTAIFDLIVHDGLKMYSMPYLSSFGWQLVILSLLFVLSGSFAKAKKRAEYLNVHLENEVEQRTLELSKTNEQLNDAKMQADRDMQLAVYVQQSFYPRNVPVMDDYDIAWCFKPMAGVSGDLYDFFVTEKKLNGLALFDVSGHGIASGLVTMLAKTVIDRKFRECAGQPLTDVLKEINETIIAEKGDVENYLTGILLRITQNKIEYINAGHPPVFFRSAKSGRCVPVQLKESGGTDGNACVIGIPGLDVDYKGIGFAMNPGDALILYTDCLSESVNTCGEQFSESRIRQAFAQSGSQDAQSKLDYVINMFNNFTADTRIKDDLTVIVVQKK